MKLVLRYYSTDECTYSCEMFIPFEYESKEKFVYDLLEKYKDYQFKEYDTGWGTKSYEKVKPFSNIDGYYMSKYEIEGIEDDVFTLEEWFEYKKEKLEI